MNQSHGLSCCCCICSLLQRGILCFAYLGVVSGDNIDTILLLSHRTLIQESSHILIICTAKQLYGLLGISHTVGVNQLYGFLGTIHFGVAINLYAGCGNSRIVGIAVKDNAAHANLLVRVAHASCSRSIACGVNLTTSHGHLTTTHEHAHAVGHIDGSTCDIECSLIGMIDTASSRRFVSSIGCKRTTTHVDSGAALTFSTIASDTSETTARKFATGDIDRSTWVEDKDGSTLGFNLATLDIGGRCNRCGGGTTFDPNHYVLSFWISRRVCKRTALKVEDAASLNINTIVSTRTVICSTITTILDGQITTLRNSNI